MVYARGTKVDVDQSRYEIERTLRRYGADLFQYAIDERLGRAAIMFRVADRHVRFVMYLPQEGDKDCRKRTQQATRNAVNQRTRERWRALLLCIKGKLESVESHIETFEEAFLAHVILPDGKTASEWLSPQIALAYEKGVMPSNLLALPAPEPED